MEQTFICHAKNENVNGIELHFSLEANEQKFIGSGNIALYNVTEELARQFKPGKKYVLTISEAKPATGK